ncbi:MAG TPA: membrane protein insertion efficiency factor YidD [Patescibacteria group bacterium]|nr:membrane protein insertion efficiency factor YidD [Patescibacteria group bacterium]
MLLDFYKKYISPIFVVYFGHACRFTPTCSEYAAQAIQKYGIVKGGFMSAWRILRCNPLSKAGYDPVI